MIIKEDIKLHLNTIIYTGTLVIQDGEEMSSYIFVITDFHNSKGKIISRQITIPGHEEMENIEQIKEKILYKLKHDNVR